MWPDMTSPLRNNGILLEWSIIVWLVKLVSLLPRVLYAFDTAKNFLIPLYYFKLGSVLLVHYSDDTSSVCEVCIATGNCYQSIVATIHRLLDTIIWCLLTAIWSRATTTTSCCSLTFGHSVRPWGSMIGHVLTLAGKGSILTSSGIW